jgi:hypothetical protein
LVAVEQTDLISMGRLAYHDWVIVDVRPSQLRAVETTVEVLRTCDILRLQA